MRIRELKLIRYGKFTDRHLTFPRKPRDIHVVVGPNEAGKSTVRNAIGDWLFGIPSRTPLAFLHPMPELRIGGALERTRPDDTAEDTLTFERAKGNKNTLRSVQDTVLADTVLQPWLGGMQLSTFNRMYALDHPTLVEGGAGILSAADDIGRLLFQSAAGIDGLGDVLEKLQAEADVLWAPRKSGARVYYQALEAYDAAGARAKQATLRARDWKSQHETLSAMAQALEAARLRDRETRLQLSQLERIRRVRPVLQALDAAQTHRDEGGLSDAVPLLPENAAVMLREAAHTLAVAQADKQRLDAEIAALRVQIDSTQVDGNLLSLAGDITALNEQRLQYRNHQADILKRSEELRAYWMRVQELAGSLGWQNASEDAVRERLPAAPLRARLMQLLRGRDTHAQQFRGAQAALAEREQQIELASKALEHLDARTPNPELANAVENALKLGDHASTLHQLTQMTTALGAALDTALAGLGPWRCDTAALAQMLVPEDSLVVSLLEESKAQAGELQSHQEATTAKTHELERLELELAQFVHAHRPITREQVMEARGKRDGEWQAIKTTPATLASRAENFEHWVSQADTLADSRLDRVQYEATTRSRQERIAQVRLELTQLQSRHQVMLERQYDQSRRWGELADAAGMPRMPLEMAPTWLRQRQRALEIQAEHAKTEQQLQQAQASGRALAQILWSLLGGAAKGGPTPSLAECIQTGRATLSDIEHAQGRRSTLEQQLLHLQSGLTGLQTAVRDAREALQSWEATWQTAVQSAGYEASTASDQVEAEMDTIQEIDRLLAAIRGLRTERIEPMHADLDALRATSVALAARAAPELTSEDATSIALELLARLTRAQQSEAALRELRAKLLQSEASHQDTEHRQLAQTTRLAPLMAIAGVDDIQALGLAVEQSDQRRAVDQRIEQALADLAREGDGLSIEALRQEAAGVAPDELWAELERLGSVSAECVEEIAQLSSQYGTLKKAFEALDGADAAAQAEACRHEAVATMADAADRYIRLQTAARLLKWSMEKFRETRQGPMLRQASATFRTLTQGSFERLLVDSESDTPRLFGIRPGGATVDVSGMSEGSRDQLYLALRLAALELQIEQGQTMPLIADDLFINFDDRRTSAGLQVLGELSSRMQVIFLTHHDHLVPLAKEVLGSDLNVITL